MSLGCNKHKTHPLSKCYSQHAEFNVSVGWDREKLKDATLYIARLTRTDRVSYTKPCEACQAWILRVGIGKVYYTDYDGELSELTKEEQRLTG
jgi:deoxycytidylate deaminase